MKWEKDLCEQIDNILHADSSLLQDQIREGILDTVEELVLAAYARGKEAGVRKAKENQG